MHKSYRARGAEDPLHCTVTNSQFPRDLPHAMPFGPKREYIRLHRATDSLPSQCLPLRFRSLEGQPSRASRLCRARTQGIAFDALYKVVVADRADCDETV